MDISKMKQKITFQKYETKIDSDGFTAQQWVNFYTCWAQVSSLNGSEFWEAMTVNAEQTITFEVRSCAKVKELNAEDYRILFRGVPYNITFIDSVQADTVKVKATVKGDGNGKV